MNPDEIREALEKAANDLGKAVNQFKAMDPEGNNWRIFERKEAEAGEGQEPSRGYNVDLKEAMKVERELIESEGQEPEPAGEA